MANKQYGVSRANKTYFKISVNLFIDIHFDWDGAVAVEDALTWEKDSIFNRFDIKCIAFSPQKWDKHSASTKFPFLHRNSVGLTPSAAPAAIPARTKHKN